MVRSSTKDLRKKIVKIGKNSLFFPCPILPALDEGVFRLQWLLHIVIWSNGQPETFYSILYWSFIT